MKFQYRKEKMEEKWYVVSDDGECLTDGYDSKREALIQFLTDSDADEQVDLFLNGTYGLELVNPYEIKEEI